MYRLLEDDYENIFQRMARNSALRACGDFKAPQFWNERKTVGDAIELKIKNYLNEAFADVSGLMMLKIDLPNPFESEIVATEVTN